MPSPGKRIGATARRVNTFCWGVQDTPARADPGYAPEWHAGYTGRACKVTLEEGIHAISRKEDRGHRERMLVIPGRE
jgi:hypothetical protein